MGDLEPASSAASVTEALRILGQEIELRLELDENDACAFDFGDGLTLTIEYLADRDAIYLWSDILRVSQSDKASLLERALTANANALAMGGTSIGFDPDRSTLILSFITPLQRFDPEDIAATCGTFMLLGDDLAKNLGNAAGTLPDSDNTDDFEQRSGIIFG